MVSLRTTVNIFSTIVFTTLLPGSCAYCLRHLLRRHRLLLAALAALAAFAALAALALPALLGNAC
jgi:hypothetical protein